MKSGWNHRRNLKGISEGSLEKTFGEIPGAIFDEISGESLRGILERIPDEKISAKILEE